MRSSKNRDAFAVLVYSILFLFFLQLITDFIAGIYAYGVLAGKIPPEMAAMILFLSPFLLLFFRRGLSTTILIVFGELLLFSRAVEVFVPTTRGQLLVAGAGTGLFLFLFPALLWDRGRKSDNRAGPLMAAGLLLAVASSILLRSLGSTMDLSNVGMFRAIAWLLAVVAAVLIPTVFRHETQIEGATTSENQGDGWVKTIMLGIGIFSVFTLLYFAFTSPIVISRWTEVNYSLVFSVATVALMLFAWLLASRRNMLAGLTRKVALAATAVFAIALTLTLWVHQVNLPMEQTLYPIADPEVSSFWIISLLIMLAIFPILFLDFSLLVEEVILSRPTLRKLGLGFGLASLIMLLLVLSNVFTSVWAYIDPFLEPFFRYKYWFYHFIAAILLAFSILAVSNKAAEIASEVAQKRIGRGFAVLVTAIGLFALVVAFRLSPTSEPPSRETERLKVVGYNIHQGYDINGQGSHQAQCALLDLIDADIIGLSESDTARIAGGNFDAPRYLAECLHMDSYVGPKTGAGTFGYALLSKYPVKENETVHLFSGPGFSGVGDPEKISEGDQVAVIKSQVSAGGQTFNIFVNHFDSNPPREQPEGFVKLVKGLDHVIAIGDYNCQPDTECFAIITETLVHCAAFGDDPDVARGQVDHIFISPDLQCQNFIYVENSASDHPVVVAEIVW